MSEHTNVWLVVMLRAYSHGSGEPQARRELHLDGGIQPCHINILLFSVAVTREVGSPT